MVLLKKWNERAIYSSFKSMPSWLLAVIGGVAWLVMFYWGHSAYEASLDYIRIANKHGVEIKDVMLGIYLIIMSVLVLYHTAIATRCGELLYQRHCE